MILFPKSNEIPFKVMKVAFLFEIVETIVLILFILIMKYNSRLLNPIVNRVIALLIGGSLFLFSALLLFTLDHSKKYSSRTLSRSQIIFHSFITIIYGLLTSFLVMLALYNE